MIKENKINNIDILSLMDKISKQITDEFEKEQLKSVVLIGIQKSGVPFSEMIQNILQKETGIDVPLGTLDISMYRDDIGFNKHLPYIHETNIPFDVDDKIVILLDDVLYSGRTVRAALDAITDYGRPKLIRLAVLINRQKQEFPIKADYIGEDIEIEANKKIKVNCEKNTDCRVFIK